MAASEENKLPPSFSGFKSLNFLHESSYDGVSGTDNDEHSLKQVSFIFGCSKSSPDSVQNGSILLVNDEL